MSDIQTRYQSALDYLYSYIDYSLTHQQNLSPENFDLSRMFALMESLGQPHQAYPSIHVAGSKGKGSASAFCAQALTTQGYKVGLYTSPHLKDFEERIQINSQSISREDLVTLVDEIKPIVATFPFLTTFEISTALAFWHFARQEVDIAVIEVGLGGRLDATNVVTPLVSAITALYLEHTYVLGDTIEEIAAEKAGIIKPGVPVVLAPQVDSAREVVAQIALERDAPLTSLGLDYDFEQGHTSLDGQRFDVWHRGVEERRTYAIKLLGPHQVENAALAVVILDVARQQGIELTDEAISQGLANTEWPGRFEILQRQPPVVVDSAHTPGAITRLQETLDEFFPEHSLQLILGMSADKDIRGMLSALKSPITKIYCTQAPHPRAMEPAALADVARFLDRPVVAVAQPGDALEAALNEAQNGDLVLVTGSIFIAASGRIAWFERSNLE
jgi:dihydrofolate synthase / folylpolyglutamate synthase